MVVTPHLRGSRRAVSFYARRTYLLERLAVAERTTVAICDIRWVARLWLLGRVVRLRTRAAHIAAVHLHMGSETNTMRFLRVSPLVAGAAILAACGGDSGPSNPSNTPPTADFTAPSCSVNVDCDFAGTGTDADGTVTGYSWDFGDQSAAVTDQNTSHKFANAGTFQVKLTVTDNEGGTG